MRKLIPSPNFPLIFRGVLDLRGLAYRDRLALAHDAASAIGHLHQLEVVRVVFGFGFGVGLGSVRASRYSRQRFRLGLEGDRFPQDS